MAFPGTYNINYYKGDTYEFNLYPKNASGQPFDLTDYTPVFTIADVRGPDNTVDITAYATVSVDGLSINCAITPSKGVLLSAGTTYVYDVQISNEDPGLAYPLIYTVLTGSITVTEDVTGAV